MNMKMTWTPIKGTPNYQSACERYVAIYQCTVRGYASYYTFSATTPASKRTMGNALVVGGLPTLIWIGSGG